MPDFFTVEDGENIGRILSHHMGSGDHWRALEMDLLRYCTRLRCQPNMGKHYTTDADGCRYEHPPHQLIKEERQ